MVSLRKNLKNSAPIVNHRKESYIPLSPKVLPVNDMIPRLVNIAKKEIMANKWVKIPFDLATMGTGLLVKYITLYLSISISKMLLKNASIGINGKAILNIATNPNYTINSEYSSTVPLISPSS